MENVVDLVKFSNGFLGSYALGPLIGINYQVRMGLMAIGPNGLPQFCMRKFPQFPLLTHEVVVSGGIPLEFENLSQFPLPTHDVVVSGVIPLQFEKNTVAHDKGHNLKLEDRLLLKVAISDLPANLHQFPLPTHDVVIGVIPLEFEGAWPIEQNTVAHDEGHNLKLEDKLLLKYTISDLPNLPQFPLPTHDVVVSGVIELEFKMNLVQHLKPRYVLMKNVADLVKFANDFLGRYALGHLIGMTYQVWIGMMAVGAYGLPQFRMRVFLWAAQLTDKNTIAHDECHNLKLEDKLLLKDAISDLPANLPQFLLPTHDVFVKEAIPLEFEV
ncbi:dna (cytosine-5)-methyltransferase cmt3 [Quercus suber]|uniref:DNA (cytosine-5-)-methyltransferase n=1 Tax=Quercus suber TaxID=58331 RepID=A0AAW0JVN7_QUESU